MVERKIILMMILLLKESDFIHFSLGVFETPYSLLGHGL
jgi:hypothetical protein